MCTVYTNNEHMMLSLGVLYFNLGVAIFQWVGVALFEFQRMQRYGCWTKNRGVFPPNHPISIGFSIIFTIHFGGFPTIFGNTHMPNAILASCCIFTLSSNPLFPNPWKNPTSAQLDWRQPGRFRLVSCIRPHLTFSIRILKTQRLQSIPWTFVSSNPLGLSVLRFDQQHLPTSKPSQFAPPRVRFLPGEMQPLDMFRIPEKWPRPQQLSAIPNFWKLENLKPTRIYVSPVAKRHLQHARQLLPKHRWRSIRKGHPKICACKPFQLGRDQQKQTSLQRIPLLHGTLYKLSWRELSSVFSTANLGLVRQICSLTDCCPEILVHWSSFVILQKNKQPSSGFDVL